MVFFGVAVFLKWREGGIADIWVPQTALLLQLTTRVLQTTNTNTPVQVKIQTRIQKYNLPDRLLQSPCGWHHTNTFTNILHTTAVKRKKNKYAKSTEIN